MPVRERIEDQVWNGPASRIGEPILGITFAGKIEDKLRMFIWDKTTFDCRRRIYGQISSGLCVAERLLKCEGDDNEESI
jgi:hypothetical protein